MNRRNRAPHPLMIALLAVSLSLAGASPSLLNAPAIAAEPSAPTTSSCCCGTAEGYCCGQVCCGMVPSQNDSQPRPAIAFGSALPDPLAASIAAVAFDALRRSPPLPTDSTWARGLPAAPTLQAEQVRIQV